MHMAWELGKTEVGRSCLSERVLCELGSRIEHDMKWNTTIVFLFYS